MRNFLIMLLFLVCGRVLARPSVIDQAVDPSLCFQAANAAERRFDIPVKLLAAIAEVESMRADPQSRRFVPWPWTINVEGAGQFYESKQDAIEAVRAFQMAGHRSIDVGCMQVSLLYHPDAFTSLDEAFDPQLNANYAAKFLRDLFRQTGNWAQAAGFYHSQTPALSADYANNVMTRWPLAARYPGPPSPAPSSVKFVDYSVYTPEFAAALKNIDRDLKRYQPTQNPANKPQPVSAPGALRVAWSHHGRLGQQPG